MTENSTSPRVGFVVAGSVSALIAMVLILAGAFALWGESKKGADGYLSTGTERFTTTGRALASERLDVEVDGSGSVRYHGTPVLTQRVDGSGDLSRAES